MKAKMAYIVVALALVLSLAAAIIPIGTVSAQPPWYVDATNCPGPGTGTLADPFCKIQSAIGNASAGDTIIVALGTYNEHDITINKSLTIQGAGAGSTVVDGQDISRVFCINNSVVDMSGMTIQNGQITDDGGGIYNDGGNVTLTNCTISSNEAYFDGGGIYNNGGNVTLTNCTINGNEVTYDGGGIYNTPDGDVTMTDCIVSDNYELGVGITDGGGIYNGGTLEMTNCTVSGNQVDYDGGGIYNGGTLEMTNCTVSDNDAGDYGGGIYNDGGNVTMNNCIIRENNASIEDGGGIYNGSTLEMTNCTVSDNYADSNGGGIYNEDTLEMTNCTVSENNANGDGGGIYNSSGNVTMTSCTVSGNEALNGDGGGIWTSGAQTLTMTNCTVSGNNAYDDGGGIYNSGNVTLTNCTITDNDTDTGNGGGICNNGELTMTCTIVYGNWASTGPDIQGSYTDTPPGESIVGGTSDPLLGPLQDNGGSTETHALLTGSPAIDACIASCNLTSDQRGQPRPVDGDNDGIANCDVGAYEKQPAVAVVGGIIDPVDRIGILTPWLGLVAFIVLAMAVLVLIQRRRLA